MELKTNGIIKFRNLSGWLKTAAVVSWITLGFWGIAFIIGFLEGFFYY